MAASCGSAALRHPDNKLSGLPERGRMTDRIYYALPLIVFVGLAFGMSQDAFRNHAMIGHLGFSAAFGAFYLFCYKCSNIIEASIVTVVLLILAGVALPLFKH